MPTALDDYREDYRQIRRECWEITGMTCPDFDQRVRDRMPDDDSRGMPSVWVETARSVKAHAIREIIGEPVDHRAEAREQEQREAKKRTDPFEAWRAWNAQVTDVDDWDERAQDAMERRAGPRY